MKPKRWGSLLVLEKYWGERFCDNNNNNNNLIIIIIIIMKCAQINVYSTLRRCINGLLVVVPLKYTAANSLPVIHYKGQDWI